MGIHPPAAVLLVDRPALVEMFAGARDLAIVCIDGSPAPVVAALKRIFRAGHRAAVLYIHDAATVIYPFSIEPLATLVACGEPAAYVDLGLPPLGTTARRFGDPSLSSGELIRDLAAIPAATLVRYCTDAARRLVARQSPPPLTTLHADRRALASRLTDRRRAPSR